ncbi:hypothetical protein CLIB1444_06S00188 [[Candida] jaroonii]|uniref:Uncharacterized protein n=1 Tax=[Candida] jaroonii TaxID=467808 RepID=A0ACA9Y8J0_9ASCO|nr:hypothetical protein CLIB1444_06S00188 [[Candida] jaroonii]
MGKKVGFAPEPEEDLKEHHEQLKKIEQDKRQYNSFQKMPPELSYLNPKTPGPKPLPTKIESTEPKPIKKVKELGDLKRCHVKDISVINKDTEINFNYPTIELPISSYNLLVQVEFAGLNSFDISKINKYYYNLSDTYVGLGYEFCGTVVDIGKNVKNGLAKGDKVFGSVSPFGRKGSLSTTLLLNPQKDFIVKIDDEMLESLENVDINLEFNEPSNLQISTLGKFSSLPVLYCKTKQALQHLKNLQSPVILINGADTNLGLTILQVLNSSLYNFQYLTLILIVEDGNVEIMENYVKQFQTPNKIFEIIEFNLENTDIVLPGEKIPINFKKPDLMAVNIFESMFKHSSETINKSNINNYKCDLIIDIIGSNWLTKTSIKYKKLDYLTLPVKFETPLSSLLVANNDYFFTKLLKPKSSYSSFVSFCKFNLKESSYSIDKLIDYSTQSNEQSLLNPWAANWTSNIANSLIKYNYHDEINLIVKSSWIMEGYQLLADNELKFKIDEFIDWRNNFKQYYTKLRKNDGKVIFSLEKF